ncbi:MAG: WD40 repeat protein [Gammaproteobacteria bacterium]
MINFILNWRLPVIQINCFIFLSSLLYQDQFLATSVVGSILAGMRQSIRPILYALFSFLLLGCTETKTALDTWTHSDTGLYGASISPNLDFLLTGDIDGFARVWDLENNSVKYSVQHQDSDDGGIIGADFSILNQVLVTMERESIARWAVESGRLTGYWKWPNLTSIAISSSGRYALIGSKDNQAIYFDMTKGKMLYVFPHHEKVNSVAISADGRFALTGSDDWHASLWSLETGEHIWARNLKYKISLVELSDDGEFALAAAYIGDAYVYSTKSSGDVVAKLDGKRMTLVSADFSDDGRLLATGRVAKSIDIWDVKTGLLKESWKPKVKHLVQPDSATILDLKIDTNARSLISETATGIGQRWSIK